MKERLALDTGPLVAWLDADDQWHGEATRMTSGLRPPFLICEPVLAEACFLLQGQANAIRQIGIWLDIGYLKFAFGLDGNAQRVFALMDKYRDLPISLADASLVYMVEANIADRVFTLDCHFRTYRHSGRRVVPVLMPER